jgi:hypothetical protein
MNWLIIGTRRKRRWGHWNSLVGRYRRQEQVRAFCGACCVDVSRYPRYLIIRQHTPIFILLSTLGHGTTRHGTTRKRSSRLTFCR